MEINILIVDDEAYSVEKLLHEINWSALGISRTYSAYSAAQAMKVLQAEPVHLLICDIEMPGASGLDLIEQINETSRLTDHPVECLMLTCHPEYEFMRKAMQLGCSDYLLKPYDPKELTAVLQKLTNKVREKHTEQLNDTGQEPENTKDTPLAATASQQEADEHIRDKVIPYIQSHIAEQISVQEIAQAVNLNAQYLMRLFRRQMGCSIIQYVTRYKIELAKDLLIHSNATNHEIAEKLGYLNTSYFLKVFKENEGIAPGAYRKKHNIYIK